jgi:chemotaxis protein methyltransferase CheR
VIAHDWAALRLDSGAAEVEDIEIRLLLEGIHLSYGYDFREYALNPLRRGILAEMARERVRTVSAYQDRVLHDAACMQRFLNAVGVNVTSMFRDPDLMRAVRQEVVPMLRTYPSPRVWIAGCASGEEVYGFAVLLAEEGALDRCKIYATDLNEDTLVVARMGVYPLDKVRRYEESYRMSGGPGTLADHYTIAGKTARFNRSLQAHVTWARHSLVSDDSFNDFQLIVCANVLIYFRESLQERAHRLLYESLVRGGYLAVGRRESLLNCPDRDHYEQVREDVNLFRKIRW